MLVGGAHPTSEAIIQQRATTMAENQISLWHGDMLSLYPMDSNAMVSGLDGLRLHMLLCYVREATHSLEWPRAVLRISREHPNHLRVKKLFETLEAYRRIGQDIYDKWRHGSIRRIYERTPSTWSTGRSASRACGPARRWPSTSRRSRSPRPSRRPTADRSSRAWDLPCRWSTGKAGSAGRTISDCELEPSVGNVAREAYRALREVVAAKIGGTIEQANSIVATAADLRNSALYGLGQGYIPQDKGKPPHDLAVVACLGKNVFA